MHRPLFLKWAYFGKSGEYEKKNMSIKIVSIFLMLQKPPQFNVAGSFYYYLIKSVFLFLTHLLPKILQQEKLSKLLGPFSGTNTTQNIGPALHCLLLLKSSLIQMHMRQNIEKVTLLPCLSPFTFFPFVFLSQFFLLVGINFTKLYFGGKRLGKTSEEG